MTNWYFKYDLNVNQNIVSVNINYTDIDLCISNLIIKQFQSI